MPSDRENLVRKTFELERDIAFVTFRRLHIEHPEIVQACPDPALREEMLRGFWNQDAEQRYPEFRQAVAGMSVERLLDLRDDLIERLEAIGLLEYREALEHASRHPANDNERGRDR